jgi:hypothetical protein
MYQKLTSVKTERLRCIQDLLRSQLIDKAKAMTPLVEANYRYLKLEGW